jgi:hypothetical protein
MSEEAERDETHQLQDEEELDEDEKRGGGGGGEGKNNCKGELNNNLNICILTQYKALLISLP